MKNTTILRSAVATPLLALALSLSAHNPTLAQQKATDKPYTYVEQMPEFKGGEGEMMKFLGTNINYPNAARSNGVEGLAVASFVVEADGSVRDIAIVKSLGHGTDEETKRVVRLMSGHWTPGSQKGQTVRVRYTLPVRFALTDADRSATANVANRMPQFKGGTEAMQQAMQTHLALPAEAKKENLNARVMLKFYVDKNGDVSNVRLDGTKLRKTVGPGSELDYMDASTFRLQNKAVLAKLAASAMAAVKATSGQWEPALKSGQPTSAEVLLPVQFLSSESGRGSEKMGEPTMTKYTKAFYKSDEVDVKPTLKDGSIEQYLAKTLRYPAGVEFEGPIGLVYTVRADGTVLHMVPTSIGKELHDIISNAFEKTNGKWNPARLDGQPVTATQTITILFVTDGEKPDSDPKKADVVVTRYK